MKKALRGISGSSEDSDLPDYLSTHLFFTGGNEAIYERWTAEPREDNSKLWDVYHQKFRMIVGTAHLLGQPDLVATGLSASEAVGLLRQREEAHPGLRHVSPLRKLRPDKEHYSRAARLVEKIAQRVSAGRLSKLRRKSPSPHGG